MMGAYPFVALTQSAEPSATAPAWMLATEAVLIVSVLVFAVVVFVRERLWR